MGPGAVWTNLRIDNTNIPAANLLRFFGRTAWILTTIWTSHPSCKYRGADKSLAPPTSRCILFDGDNISFDSSLVIYINSTNITAIMIINWIYEDQNLLSL